MPILINTNFNSNLPYVDRTIKFNLDATTPSIKKKLFCLLHDATHLIVQTLCHEFQIECHPQTNYFDECVGCLNLILC